MPPSNVFYRKHTHTLPAISHGQGIYLWDTDGKRYVDASGGAVVINVGHGVPEIAAAIHGQAARVAYAHATMFTSPVVEELATRLAARVPVPDARFFFMSSGSEATETAVKLARQIQIARGQSSRYKVIGRWGSYHGATLGALAITGKPSLRHYFEPMFLDMPHIPPVYCYRCPLGLTYPSCAVRCADALEDEIRRQGADTVAAFIGEPIAGATLGAVVPPPEYWPRVSEICERYRVLLIADEVMTGMGRTGQWFAIEQWGVVPDILCLGKGLAGGYVPQSAVAARGELVDLLWNNTGDFNHGGTFSHQPVAAAAALATLNYLVEHDLVARARDVGAYLGTRLHSTFDQNPNVGEVRGEGLLWAVELVANRASRAPFPTAAHVAGRVFERAFERGWLFYTMSGGADGVLGDLVMIAPPFVVERDQVDSIVEGLEAAIQASLEDS